MPLSVVVLAAGKGKRMHSELPKVLHPVAGKPLLGHVLDTARALGAAGIHVVYGHGGESVSARFPESDLSWHLQDEQLGTGHAVAAALPAVPDGHRVLVLCGDVPLISVAALARLLKAAEGAELAVLTATVADPSGYGRIVRDSGRRMTRVVEQKDASAAELEIAEINTGIVVADSQSLRGWLARIRNDNAQGEYYLTDIIGLAVDDGKVVESAELDDAAEAMGINDKSQLAQAERICQRREAERLLAAGVTLADPARLDVRGRLECGSDVFIDVGVVIEGSVSIGDGCRIGAYAVIRNTTIGAGTEIHPHSVIEDSTIGNMCQIGPFARLRPDSDLAERVKIGNFVETKKSRIAPGSKINHLSYVGDTTVGSNVNIGAGTIVCNYDGANKHRTTIGDDVFIGSGTELVAPVSVGSGATVGAGSTITKDVPDGKLAIARARQTLIEGWRRPVKKRG